jgi:hypothetical protein
MTEKLAEAIIKRDKELSHRKNPWLNHFQLLGEYIHQRKQSFTSEHTQGEFLNRDIFSGAGGRSAKISASSLLSRLWPQTKRKFVLKAPKKIEETTAVKDYFEDITDVLLEIMDDPKGGFNNAAQEYMLDQVVFGTSGIEINRDSDPDSGVKIIYTPWGVSNMSIDDGRYGVVDTVYITINRAVSWIVKEYGEENVSTKVMEAFNKGKLDTKFDIIISIEPRITAPGGATKGKKAMAFQSVHVEKEAKKVIREGGFDESPIKVGRMTKLMKETYGRSFGMDALPDVLQANVVAESVTIAIEKNLDPPLYVMDDGRLGGGVIDSSAGALNVFNVSGRGGSDNPVGALFTVGDVIPAEKLLERLEQSIAEHFAIDRLLDFNNQTRMTFGETQIRDKNRNETLSGVLGRQITEVFSPAIERSYNISFEDGHLGFHADDEDGIADYEERHGRTPIIIPDEISELMDSGENVYEIEYFTPAMRIIQAEEAGAIVSTWEAAAMIAQLNPDVLHNLNPDESIRRLSNMYSAPTEILHSMQEVKAVRQQQAEDQMAAQEMAQMQQGSEAARNIGQSGLVPTQKPQEGS